MSIFTFCEEQLDKMNRLGTRRAKPYLMLEKLAEDPQFLGIDAIELPPAQILEHYPNIDRAELLLQIGMFGLRMLFAPDAPQIITILFDGDDKNLHQALQQTNRYRYAQFLYNLLLDLREQSTAGAESLKQYIESYLKAHAAEQDQQAVYMLLEMHGRPEFNFQLDNEELKFYIHQALLEDFSDRKKLVSTIAQVLFDLAPDNTDSNQKYEEYEYKEILTQLANIATSNQTVIDELRLLCAKARQRDKKKAEAESTEGCYTVLIHDEVIVAKYKAIDRYICDLQIEKINEAGDLLNRAYYGKGVICFIEANNLSPSSALCRQIAFLYGTNVPLDDAGQQHEENREQKALHYYLKAAQLQDYPSWLSAAKIYKELGDIDSAKTCILHYIPKASDQELTKTFIIDTLNLLPPPERAQIFLSLSYRQNIRSRLVDSNILDSMGINTPEDLQAVLYNAVVEKVNNKPKARRTVQVQDIYQSFTPHIPFTLRCCTTSRMKVHLDAYATICYDIDKRKAHIPHSAERAFNDREGQQEKERPAEQQQQKQVRFGEVSTESMPLTKTQHHDTHRKGILKQAEDTPTIVAV